MWRQSYIYHYNAETTDQQVIHKADLHLSILDLSTEMKRSVHSLWIEFMKTDLHHTVLTNEYDDTYGQETILVYSARLFCLVFR